MSLPLSEFLRALDRHMGRIPLDELVRRMAELSISLRDVERFAHFGHKSYQRNLLHAGPAYQALVLCWRSGQRSPIHDHRESSCGVRVIQGEATETWFDRTPDGLIYATGSRRLPAGSHCGSQDADIHQMSNLQPPGHDLVTLHVYSPPLMNMGMYSLTDSRVAEFVDPIVGLLEGAGI